MPTEGPSDARLTGAFGGAMIRAVRAGQSAPCVGNPRCAGGRTGPHKGHSVNQAREPETAITGGRATTDVKSSSHPAAPVPPRTNWLWAELMQRSFGFDVLVCPRCRDRLKLIALIEDPKVIGRIGRSEPWYDADDVTAP